MSNFSDTFSDAPSDAVRSTGVHRATWGIFNIAYEPPSWKTKISEFSPTEHLAALDSAQFAWRFICEVCCIAPRCFISYVLASWWISITPALSLYFSHLVIDTVRASPSVPRDSSDQLIISRSMSVSRTLSSTTTVAAIYSIWYCCGHCCRHRRRSWNDLETRLS
ncbi:hypothetical protein L208DRAFT_601251 [Tricholoma matsutake]|nr:hypothetical protein L208DRAFT_601251 [Tricholoma matsutake 945]